MNNNQPVTKQELENTLDKWTHEQVVPVVEGMFKRHGEDIKKEIKINITEFKTEIREARQEITKSKDDIAKSKNEILDSNDKLIAELKKKNEEEAAHSLSHRQIKDSLDEHDKRLKAIEPQPA